MKNATIKSATAKWHIIKLILERRWRFDRNRVIITERFPAAAITNITQYATTRPDPVNPGKIITSGNLSNNTDNHWLIRDMSLFSFFIHVITLGHKH